MQTFNPSKAQFDNLIRQKLMIADPGNAEEVARGLQQRYAAQADVLARDRTGEAGTTAALMTMQGHSVSPSTSEFSRAKDDVGRDLQGLIAEPQLKDVTPELRGWQGAITRLIDDGAGAAALALDQRQRDRAFDTRRALGDYARLARLLGAATPAFNSAYRQLAKSLDEVASLILVIAGETIAGQGQGGAHPLPAPASDLQARRDAVLAAVHSLIGSAQQSYGTSEWPRGLHAFRELNETLQESGHGDLRVMLNPNQLGSPLTKSF